jgi:hypothetical protein
MRTALGQVSHPRREAAVAMPINAAVMMKADGTITQRDIWIESC